MEPCIGYFTINRHIFTINVDETDEIFDIVNDMCAMHLAKSYTIISIEDTINNKFIQTSYEIDSPKIEGKFEVGVKYNVSRHYFKSKQVALDLLPNYFYKENGCSGVVRKYYVSGALQREFYHVNGLIEGPYSMYNEDETLRKTLNFINGKCLG